MSRLCVSEPCARDAMRDAVLGTGRAEPWVTCLRVRMTVSAASHSVRTRNVSIAVQRPRRQVTCPLRVPAVSCATSLCDVIHQCRKPLEREVTTGAWGGALLHE